jgi:nitroreductase
MNAAMTNLEYFLTSTRSARKSLDLDAPVDMAEIGECLEIGLHAANGSNQQTWRWIVVTDVALRAKIAQLYRNAYRSMTAGRQGNEAFGNSDFGRLMSSTEWLVEHLGEVPLLVIPCYEPWLPRTGGSDSFYCATMYGSIFPAVWNFQLALHTRGYGTCITTLHLHREKEIRALLGIPETCIQGCLLPVARLRAGHRFRTTPRRPLAEVAVLDRWNGPSMVSSPLTSIAHEGETAMAFSADTKLGDLLDNPEAKAVLLKHVPEISSAGPMLNMARGMTLKMVTGFPQANISAEKLQAIVADLEKL